MFPSFTGSARRPRQVNLSGRSSNPFAATAASRPSPSAQTAQNTVAHAQAERALRQQERLRLPAATTIQRSWRGHRSRKEARSAWRKDWDAKEEADLPPEHLGVANNLGALPYKNETDCLDQMKLLVHFASLREPGDMDRLKHFARRYRSSAPRFGSACPSDIWISPLIRLGKLTISMLNQRKPVASLADVDALLELLCALATAIPEKMSSYSMEYYEALRSLALGLSGGRTSDALGQDPLEKSIVALLRPMTARTIKAYEGFASQFLRLPDMPSYILQALSDDIRIEELKTALSRLLSAASPENLLQSRSREELLWLVTYFLYFHRSTKPNPRPSADALYVNVLSKLISHLSADIASRIDATANAATVQADNSSSLLPKPRPPLPPFVRTEIMNLISQDHVSSLLAQAGSPEGEMSSMVAKKQTSALAVYALTLLRSFPRRGDEIRMWLYLGSTSRTDVGQGSSTPAIKYYYNAASQTSIYKLIKNEPRNAISLLNPNARTRANVPTIPDPDQQWHVILLFLELYPIALKVMDDEEFLSGAEESDPSASWTRQSALTLDQVRDLTVFLKNLAFSMYWNASEIAGVEEPENKSSIAEYFSGNLAAFSDHHPDAKTTKPKDTAIADLSGMTISYLKGLVTGLLRMIYERE
ncbi:MAG: hypothetical protein Q9201_006271 [Fulgogasparrea decipioides]